MKTVGNKAARDKSHRLAIPDRGAEIVEDDMLNARAGFLRFVRVE